MNRKEVVDFFSDLSNTEKAAFLCRLSFELTVSARETYEVGTEELEKPKLMRSINEVQNRILGYASALLRAENSADFEKTLWLILFDDSNPELKTVLQNAVSHVVTLFAPALV